MNTEVEADFLSIFNNELKELFGEYVSYRRLFTKGFKLHTLDYKTSIDSSELIKKIYTLNNILTYIQNIIYKPHTHVEEAKTIKRSEISGAVSPANFKETVKDSKLWSIKDDEFAPQYVHTTEIKTKFDIYENQFICYLIDYIESIAKDLIMHSDLLIQPIGKMYDFLNPTFGKMSVYNDFYGEVLPIKLYDEKIIEDKNRAPLKAEKILTKIKRFKHTSFYKKCYNPNFSPNVTKTNILVHDVNYFKCYSFYESHKNSFLKEDQLTNKRYWNYIVCSFISYIETSKIFKQATTAKAKFVEPETFSVDGLEVMDSKFNYKIDFDHKNYVISVKSNLLVENHGDIENKLGILIVPEITKNNLELIKNKKNIMEKSFDEVVVISMKNETLDYDDISIINYYNSDSYDIFEKIFISLRLVYKVPRNYFDMTCPYCGEANVSIKENSHTCLSCGAKYRIIHNKKSDYVWLTKFGRIKQ